MIDASTYLLPSAVSMEKQISLLTLFDYVYALKKTDTSIWRKLHTICTVLDSEGKGGAGRF